MDNKIEMRLSMSKKFFGGILILFKGFFELCLLRLLRMIIEFRLGIDFR